MRVRGQARTHGVHLGQHERTVAHERLGPAPRRPDLVGAMARPGIRPVRGEDVGEVVARLAQVHLERPVVERLRRGDVVEQERRDVPLLAQLAPGVDEVAGGHRMPVAPARVLAQHEEVRQAVGGDVHVLRQLRDDVEVVVDAQEPAEELLDHDRRVARVRVAGRVGVGPDERDLEPGGSLRALAALLARAVEGRVVGLAGARVVERQVAHERDLEERLALARGIVEPAQERARPAVVLDRLVVGVDGPRGVAREQQVACRALRLVGLGEVARERPVERLVRLSEHRLERLADAAVEAAPGRLEQARIRHLLHQPVAEAVLRGGPAAHLHDQVEPHQIRQRRHDLLARQEPLEQRQAEAAADRARDRHDLARARRQPVEPGLQRALHERRHGDLPVGELPAAVAAPQRAALDQVLERLLEEEGVAAGALGEQVRERPRAASPRPAPRRARGSRPPAAAAARSRGSGAGRRRARARPGATTADRGPRGRSARRPAAPRRSARAGPRRARASASRPTGDRRRRCRAAAPRPAAAPPCRPRRTSAAARPRG